MQTSARLKIVNHSSMNEWSRLVGMSELSHVQTKSKVSMKTSVLPSEGAALMVLEMYLILSRLEKTLHLSDNFYLNPSCVKKQGWLNLSLTLGSRLVVWANEFCALSSSSKERLHDTECLQLIFLPLPARNWSPSLIPKFLPQYLCLRLLMFELL